MNKVELATRKWKKVREEIKSFRKFFDKNFPQEKDRVFLTIFKFVCDLDEEISTL
jgi:hypothetical protein